MIAVVLGMRRSGTSLVSNLCEALGYDMGRMRGGEKANNMIQQHYWEDQPISWFHIELLHAAGGSWLYPPGRHAVDRALSVDKDLAQRMNDLIAQRQIRRQWGFKCPRTALLVDAWHDMLPSPKLYIEVRRNPVAVAESNMRSKWKNGFASGKAYLSLAYRYRRRIADFTRRRDPAILPVHFEALVSERYAEFEVKRMASFLDVKFDPNVLDVINYRT
ncbi:hypothetical protein GF373_17675 [bacterium]|nr:hypothetical protein [bacterium]